MLEEYLQTKIDEALELMQNDTQKALKIFDEILEIEPENINAINGKGSTLMKLNKTDEAEKCFDKSLELNENSPALINKGIISKNREEYTEALNYYDRAIEINPDMKNIVNILKNEVYELIEDSSQIDTNSFSSECNEYIQNGLILKNNDDIWEALDCYNKAFLADSRCENAISALIDEIENILFNEFLFNTPSFKKTKIDKLKIQALRELLIEENPENALTLFDIILEINENDIDTINYKGCSLFLFAKYDEAINCFDKCLMINNEYHYALFNKGLILRRMNKLQEALECFDEVLKTKNDYDKVKSYQIEILEKLNN